MRKVLEAAIAGDPDRDETAVMDQLEDGELTAMSISGGASGIIVTQTLKSALWVIYVAGHIEGRRIPIMQHLMRGLEYAARRADCGQIHIIGRKGWVKVLTSQGFQYRPAKSGQFHLWKAF